VGQCLYINIITPIILLVCPIPHYFVNPVLKLIEGGGNVCGSGPHGDLIRHDTWDMNARPSININFFQFIKFQKNKISDRATSAQSPLTLTHCPRTKTSLVAGGACGIVGSRSGDGSKGACRARAVEVTGGTDWGDRFQKDITRRERTGGYQVVSTKVITGTQLATVVAYIFEKTNITHTLGDTHRCSRGTGITRAVIAKGGVLC
jgi:hypothetical protein